MKTIGLTILSVACLALSANTATAQNVEDPSVEAPVRKPACTGSPYRDFDFWIGTWEVRSPDGALAGTNRITSEESGCLLVERWTSASGGTGQSYNFVDRDTGDWRQVWVSTGATINYSGGLDADGAMILEGRIGYLPGSDNNGRFRGKWTLREDGTVEQVFHQYSEDTDEWKSWFKGIYTKIDETE